MQPEGPNTKIVRLVEPADEEKLTCTIRAAIVGRDYDPCEVVVVDQLGRLVLGLTIIFIVVA